MARPIESLDQIESKIREIASTHVDEMGGVISSLREIQMQLGYLPQATEELVAEVFNVSRAEIKGVISFYSDFTRSPEAETKIRVCSAEACQAVGARELIASLEASLSVKMGDTSTDQKVSLVPVYCLGLCSVGPAAMVQDRLVGHATCDRVLNASSVRDSGESR